MKVVTLYGRPGCHLCDEARAVLKRIASTQRFRLEEIDIESDDELFKALSGADPRGSHSTARSCSTSSSRRRRCGGSSRVGAP